MAALGRISILFALISSLATAALITYGMKRRSGAQVRLGHFGLLASLLFTFAASLALLMAFLGRDFSLIYVYNHSNRSLSPIFTLAAFWGGQEGSLLFWQLLISAFSAVFLINGRKGRLNQHALLILAAVQLFFLLLLAGVASPFKVMAQTPVDGMGLNPLLLHIQMVFHPPILFAGYAATAVPFALGIAALITGQADGGWVRTAKKWALFAQVMLSIGILLGALWAYDELAFGGYWAWDPVENASLLPWLMGSALLHTLNIHERRGLLKLWSPILTSAAFISCILATVITRSGVIESVHAFGRSPIAAYFTWMLIVLTLASAVIIIFKGKEFASDELDSLLSKSYGFHLNNVILIFFAVVITFGTFYPPATEALFGARISLGPLFFMRIIPPLGLIYLGFLGVCPLLGEKETERSRLARRAAPPLILAAVTFSLAFFLWGNKSFASLGLGISAFTMATTLTAILAPAKDGAKNLFVRLKANRSRYGGYLAHFGIAAVFVGLIGTSYYPTSGQASLEKGESFKVGPLTVANLELKIEDLGDKVENTALLKVEKASGRKVELSPKLIYHKSWKKTTAKVAIEGGLFSDLYANLMQFHESGTIHVELKINPFASWLWIGTWIMILGTALAFLPLGGAD